MNKKEKQEWEKENRSIFFPLQHKEKQELGEGKSHQLKQFRWFISVYCNMFIRMDDYSLAESNSVLGVVANIFFEVKFSVVVIFQNKKKFKEKGKINSK